MPIYRDKERGRYLFEFDRFIEGQRIRARKLLPKTWTRTQADAYDRKESARLYEIACGIRRPEHLIEDAVKVYLTERAVHLKSRRNIEGELAHTFWAYKGKPMSELSQACSDIRTKSKGVSDGTIRNRIRYLTSACRYGWRHHSMCEHDPAQKVVLPSVNNERRYFITRAQMLVICRACDCRRTRAGIRIAFYSGMRQGEIIKGKEDNDLFVLDDTKNGEPRMVPIHPKIKSAIRWKPTDPYRTSKRFKAAAIKAGMPHLRFHDLRHSAASAMINAGVDLYTVGAVLGHKSSQSTQRYAHLATDTLRVAVSKIGNISPTTKTKRVA